MTETLTFTRGRIAPVGILGEAWRRARDQYWLLLLVTAFGFLLGTAAPLGLLMGPMMCGVYTCYLDKARGQKTRFERVFAGFESPVLVQSIIATLITMAATLVVVLPMILGTVVAGFTAGVLNESHARSSPPPVLFFAIFGALFLLWMIVMGAVSTLFMFVLPLVADRKMAAIDALKLGVRAAWANIVSLLLFMLAATLLNIVGACFCYVGVLLMFPVTMGAQVVAYEAVFGLAPTPASPVPAAAS